jgi:CDP-diacylglycerol--serine O-phosphatidyltransferase
LRLARFNVQTGSMDPRYFNGFPIPAAAMVIATAIAFYYEIGEWAPEKHKYILVMIYVLSFLMVSNIKYFSFKKVELFKRHPFQTLVAAVLLFVAVATAPELMGFPLMCAYVGSGAISSYLYFRRPRLPEKPEEEPAPKPAGP